jgi:hypothetical protein
MTEEDEMKLGQMMKKVARAEMKRRKIEIRKQTQGVYTADIEGTPNLNNLPNMKYRNGAKMQAGYRRKVNQSKGV